MTEQFLRRAHAGAISFDTRASATGGDDGWVVSGYVTKTGVAYEPYYGWDRTESVAAGAFDTLDDDMPKFKLEHEGLALASVGSGTMTVREDKTGLRFSADLQMDDPDAMRLMSKVKAGVIDGSSVGMWVRKIEYDRDNNHQTITSAQLIEISAVSEPAQPAATIAEGRAMDGDLVGRIVRGIVDHDNRAVPDIEALVDRAVERALTSRNLVVTTRELAEQAPLPFDASSYIARLEALA